MKIVPGYWMYETSGVLRPAIEAYLHGGPMKAEHITLVRDYLRQWMAAPVWIGPEMEELRAGIDGLTTREAINDWLDLAIREGIDPL